jgi:hypothetical protein
MTIETVSDLIMQLRDCDPNAKIGITAGIAIKTDDGIDQDCLESLSIDIVWSPNGTFVTITTLNDINYNPGPLFTVEGEKL